MLADITAKAEHWASRWAEVAFTPRQAVLKRGDKHLSSVEFFVGNYLGAYVGTLLVSVSYFILLHRPTFTIRIRDNGAELLAFATGGFAAYVVVSFITLFLFSVVTYGIYRALGSKAELNHHLQVVLSLTFLEPFAAFPAAAFFLVEPSPLQKSFPFAVIAAYTLFLLTRLVHLVYGSVAMRALHPLPNLRQAIGFVGFASGVLVFNIVGLSIGWLLLVFIVIGGD